MKFSTSIAIATCTTLFTLFAADRARAFEIFFGEDPNAGGSFVEGGNATAARDDFLSRLTGVNTESFESFAPLDFPLPATTTPLSLSFEGSLDTIEATLTGSMTDPFEGVLQGAFATTGTRYLLTFDEFAIDFDTPVAAFGFFINDVEFNSPQLVLDLASGGQQTLTVPITLPTLSGGLAFYGFIDADNPVTRVAFSNATATESFGFDDLIVGDVGQVIESVPEPIATLGLLAVAGDMAIARKRKAIG